ncbi:MAG: hypothetical protein MUF00_00655 [Gemmatimonadaceae bacterium]|jgi:hypothetical protein|nr:hypothetical protein [Gemmatimonadaceae bacterium]
MMVHDASDDSYDARQDPPRDALLSRALSRVDAPALAPERVAALRARIVRDVAAAQPATPPSWVLTVARPARRVLPWAAIAAAASLVLTWRTATTTVTGDDDAWTTAMLGGVATSAAFVEPMGLPASPDALLQESLSR